MKWSTLFLRQCGARLANNHGKRNTLQLVVAKIRLFQYFSIYLQLWHTIFFSRTSFSLQVHIPTFLHNMFFGRCKAMNPCKLTNLSTQFPSMVEVQSSLFHLPAHRCTVPQMGLKGTKKHKAQLKLWFDKENKFHCYNTQQQSLSIV